MTDQQTSQQSSVSWAIGGVAVVVVLGAVVRFLEQTVPDAAEGTALADLAPAVEYPIYAIAFGLLGNVILTLTGLRDRLSPGFRTEFFIETGLVLPGASINFAVIVGAAGPAVLQAFVLITVVFGFTWWPAGRLGIDDRLRALLASAVVAPLREAGWRPIGVFAGATVVNLAVGLGVAVLLFANVAV